MPRPDWTPHRRDDRELLGWIHPDGDGWVAVDVLGRPASDRTEWLDAEAALEARGIAWLSDSWILEGDEGHQGDQGEEGEEGEESRPLRVRILEVTPDDDGVPGRIVVKVDDFGDVARPPVQQIVLDWPIPDRLRQPLPTDPDPRVI